MHGRGIEPWLFSRRPQSDTALKFSLLLAQDARYAQLRMRCDVRPSDTLNALLRGTQEFLVRFGRKAIRSSQNRIERFLYFSLHADRVTGRNYSVNRGTENRAARL